MPGDPMFRKADGTEVWLRLGCYVPYFKIEGNFNTTAAYDRTLKAVKKSYDTVSGVSHGPTFHIGRFAGEGNVLLCLEQPTSFAFILIGAGQAAPQSIPLDHAEQCILFHEPQCVLNDIIRTTKLEAHVHTIGCELSAVE